MSQRARDGGQLPVLHIEAGTGERTRAYLGRLLSVLSGVPGQHPAALVCGDDPVLIRRASRAGVVVSTPSLGRGRVRDVWAAVVLGWQMARHTGARVVHAHGLDALAPAAIVARLRRAPIVLSLYALPKTSVRRLALRAVARTLVPLAEYAQPVRSALGVAAETIHCGLDPRGFDGSAVPQRVVRELGLDPYTLRFGMVAGEDGSWDGGEVFVRAAAQTLQRIPSCDFVVIGPDSFLKRAEDLAHHLRVLGRFRLLPNDGELPRILTALSAVAFPGNPRTFPWEVVEAGASRIPIVASDVPVHREILDGAPEVTWIPSADVGALAAELVRVLTSTPASRGDLRGYLSARRTSQTKPDELPAWARPSPVGYDLSSGDMDEYEIMADDYTRRKVLMFRRFSMDEAVAKLVSVYRAAAEGTL